MPIVREPLDPKLSRWHFLAYYLRVMREREGLSLTQWGKIIGAARSTVSNMEAGRHRLHEDHARAIDARFETGRLIELMLWYARMGHDPNWFCQLITYERQSTECRYYHGQAIPLPVQTDDYTWALVQAGDFIDHEAELAARIERKKAILEREDPPHLWVIMDEHLLACPMGGAAIMRAQLLHLRELADRRHAIVQIVPTSAGSHQGMDGPFQIVGMESRDVAYVGAQRGGRLIEAPSEVKEQATIFHRIGAKALSEDGSRALIDQYLEKYP